MPRSLKYRAVTRLERINNRITRWALHRGLAPRAFGWDAAIGRAMASRPLTIRVDLDPTVAGSAAG